MISHDYYKLLKISSNASEKEIQSAYRKIALVYHPDKKPNDPKAEEYFKLVTEAYNVLSNPDKKRKFDQIIQGVYIQQNQKREKEYDPRDRRYKSQSKEEIRRKVERIKRKREEENVQLYEERESKISHKLRYSVIGIILLFGYLFAFNRWFINENSFDIFYILMGLGVFILSAYILTNHLYIQLRAWNIIGKVKKWNAESTSVGLFVFLFLGGPVSIVAINAIKKEYHLSYHYIYLDVSSQKLIGNKIKYTYMVNGKEISKTSSEYSDEELDAIYKNNNSKAKVSKYNPKISVIEFEALENNWQKRP